MRERICLSVSLSIVIGLLVGSPAIAEVAYTGFANVYDLDNPWAAADWNEINNSAGTWSNPDGFLDYADSHTADWALWQYTADGSDPLGGATDWTVELNAQVNGQGAQTGSATQSYAGLYVAVMNNADVLTEMVLQSNAVQLRTASGWETIDTSDNSDDYHTFRLVKHSGGIGVFRDGDGNPLGGSQTYAPADGGPLYSSTSLVIFGDNAYAAGSTDGFDASIDYLAFDVGNSYFPDEPPPPEQEVKISWVLADDPGGNTPAGYTSWDLMVETTTDLAVMEVLIEADAPGDIYQDAFGNNTEPNPAIYALAGFEALEFDTYVTMGAWPYPSPTTQIGAAVDIEALPPRSATFSDQLLDLAWGPTGGSNSGPGTFQVARVTVKDGAEGTWKFHGWQSGGETGTYEGRLPVFIPEPATLLVLFLGSLMYLLRKRS